MSKAQTIENIIQECHEQGINQKEQIAYILATMQWETAHTFEPVKEAYWKSELWRKKHFRYYPYYGRGYVQLTWKRNYELYGKLLNVDLVEKPDLALEPGIARYILVHGFKEGTFTGKKISDYINEKKVDFLGARQCINGRDRDRDIAEIASKVLATLK